MSTASSAQSTQEAVFFEYEDVKVTSARFISGGQTYAMSNVTSVKTFEEKPKRFWGLVILFIGLGAALLESEGRIFGGLVAIVAAFYLYKQKTLYHVMLSTAGGETSALKTHQKVYLDKVVGALNNSIVHRG